MVRNEVAVAPVVPNADTAANPTGPQLQAPALVPIIDPRKPVPDFFMFSPNLIRYMLRLITSPDIEAIRTIKEKLRISSLGT